ncbi:MAG: glycosyltransferase [Flavobacteriales bacterium]|nr:glycosyltransferase [Flavobacteriales bacterium]
MGMLVCIAGLTYLAFIGILHLGWSKATQEPSTDLSSQREVLELTIVIPFRNEVKNIGFLLNDLIACEIPKNTKLHIKWVDDGSDDGSTVFVSKAIAGYDQHLLIRNSGRGKVDALRTGIQATDSPWIITLDADIRLPSDWMRRISFHLSSSDASDMLILPLYGIVGETLISKYGCIDFASLVCSSLAMGALGRPIMANGAHLAFKRKYATWSNEIVSGDDVFLLHNIKSQGGQIKVIADKRLQVMTDMPATWTELISQRTRWASKARQYTDRDTLIIGWYLLFLNLLIWVLLCAGIFKSELLYLSLMLLLVKSIADWTFVIRSLDWTGQRSLIPLLPLASLIQTLMYPVAFFNRYFSGFDWKGRHYQ